MKKILIWLFLGLLAAGFIAWALRPNPVPVETSVAVVGPIQVAVEQNGEVRARDVYAITAPVAGRLARMNLREGDLVEAGQLLAHIAPLPLSMREREEITARVAAAQAALNEAEDHLKQTEASLEQTKRDRERAQQLVNQGFSSSQSLEKIDLDLKLKTGDYEAVRDRMQSAAADLRAARAPLDVDRQGRVVRVTAPVTGKVFRIENRSERVVAAGAPLLQIADPHRLEVVADVLTTDAVNIKPGMPVFLDHWGGSGVLKGQVRLIEPSAFRKISALGVEEQRVNVVADFLEPSAALSDGFRVTVRIVTAEKENVLKIPSSGLFRSESDWAVFVVSEGVARKRIVELGLRNSAEAEVVGGVSAGAEIIRYPSNRLTDGARVIVSTQ